MKLSNHVHAGGARGGCERYGHGEMDGMGNYHGGQRSVVSGPWLGDGIGEGGESWRVEGGHGMCEGGEGPCRWRLVNVGWEVGLEGL